MKNKRQVLALIGVILLVLLYASTIIFALIDDPRTFHLLGVSVVATIIIPIIIWVVGIFVRLDKKEDIFKDEKEDRP